VFFSLVRLFAGGRLQHDIVVSILRVSAGVLLSSAIVVVLAIATAYRPIVGAILSGPIELARPVPPIAWIPLAIMMLGLGDRAAVSIVALGSFFPVWMGALQGLSRLEQRHLHAARSLGAGRFIILTDVVIPSVMPFLLHGLRLGVGIGWFSVVAAEMMGAPSGLGQGIQLLSLNLQIAELYGYILVIGAIGFVFNFLLLRVERHVGRWRAAEDVSIG
jgi:ABC-type nitrate/sulfonate/bicarbonate transport system permease component